MTQSNLKQAQSQKLHFTDSYQEKQSSTSIVCFTPKGLEIAKTLGGFLSAKVYAKYDSFEADNHESIEEKNQSTTTSKITSSLADWTLEKQKAKETLIFVGALGICVRSIAEGIKNKLTDAPVVVVDETGEFVIPVLSGHFGGANELANQIAQILQAIPVITTATDREEVFSVDVFARENNLSIVNKEGIKKVSSKALEGKAIRLSIENYPPQNTDVVITSDFIPFSHSTLTLCPKEYAIGIGCKKDTPFESLKEFFDTTLAAHNISSLEVGAIGSIDLKTEEEGLILLGKHYKIPFITYTKELLQTAKGTYEESEFVKKQTGIGNVCERAAMLLTGNQGEILLHKTTKNGMTIAIAKIHPFSHPV